MKKQIVMMMAAVLMCCTSCVRVNLGEIGKLKPSDNVVKNEYRMEPFSKIDIDLVARVKFMQTADGDYRVLLKCPDNYVDLFKFEVDGDELDLSFVHDMHKSIDAKDVAIIVCSPTLLQIDSEGVGSLTIDSLRTPTLSIDNEGVGSINVKGLHTETLTVESNGVGSIELQGEARAASFDSDGVGSINAGELKAGHVKAEINGVGSITCFASESIIGQINGVGSLRYGGNPEHKQLQRNGVGKISEL